MLRDAEIRYLKIFYGKKNTNLKFIFENSQVEVDYRVVDTLSGYEVIFFRFINPAQGVWKINVYSLTNIKGSFNGWLPINNFLQSDTFFLNSTPDTTLTEQFVAMGIDELSVSPAMVLPVRERVVGME